MLALLTAAIENPDDREFMTQFYLEYERLMYATVRKRLTDPEAAKDIVQECVIRLIPKIPFLRRQERCIKASYVVSTVRNTTINYMRKQGRTDGRCCSLEEQEEQDMAAGMIKFSKEGHMVTPYPYSFFSASNDFRSIPYYDDAAVERYFTEGDPHIEHIVDQILEGFDTSALFLSSAQG